MNITVFFRWLSFFYSFPHVSVENYFPNPLHSGVYRSYPHVVGNYTNDLLDREGAPPYLAVINGISFNFTAR